MYHAGRNRSRSERCNWRFRACVSSHKKVAFGYSSIKFRIKMKSFLLFVGVLCLVGATASRAAENAGWEEAIRQMPLGTEVKELNRTNAVPLTLKAFQKNSTVKGLIWMPGATDEFYFFKRAHVTLTNDSPTLLDAIRALTNQTWVRVTYSAPLLILHTAEDPMEGMIQVEDQKMAERIAKKHFVKAGVFLDKDWDYVQPILAFQVDTRVEPPRYSPHTTHFYRHSMSVFDLNGMEALTAICLANKTIVHIEKKKLVFEGDTRVRAKPSLEGISTFDAQTLKSIEQKKTE
ncbi:MAG: hypothetical protein JWN25_1617 [Verrucomicrobiales bacterium]|nr:hypothetical protein [Verrucomicrobiales bacterium]